MVSVNRMDLVKKVFPFCTGNNYPLNFYKNVLESKFLGANPVLKVTSPMLIRIYFYLALFLLFRFSRTSSPVNKCMF